ncbi:unnamed protein product [Psylliodes chrysocephalus]|uniref:Uncharacterized protein n=1 Tax=Psylliodes chrysocephalus TaxID=3402493 RepID=A0A9P0D980_9CUCU|nr:unnamed protein product [Psylliodes chrysocephala]
MLAPILNLCICFVYTNYTIRNVLCAITYRQCCQTYGFKSRSTVFVLLKLSVEEFWFRLSQMRNFTDDLEYSNIVKLAKLCKILPHSNAETEKKIDSEVINAVSVIRFSSKNVVKDLLLWMIT